MTDGKSDDSESKLEAPKLNAEASKTESPYSASPSHGGEGPSRARAAQSPVAAFFKGVVNVVSTLLLVYLTYFFTMYFSTRPPGPAPVSEVERTASKKTEELRAEDHQLLSSYGWVNPATKSVRIPID